MLRGFISTLAVVSAITLTAWTFADQSRTASATTVAEMTPAATSATTNSNLAAKGDQLSKGVRLSGLTGAGSDGAVNRIAEAHTVAMLENAGNQFMTVAVSSGHASTTLVRVPVRD